MQRKHYHQLITLEYTLSNHRQDPMRKHQTPATNHEHNDDQPWVISSQHINNLKTNYVDWFSVLNRMITIQNDTQTWTVRKLPLPPK